jgi:hypothetical protein
VAPAREVVRQEYRIPSEARAHIQSPDGVPGQPAVQCRSDSIPVVEEVMPAASSSMAGMVHALSLVDHDCQLISLVKRET